MKQYQRQSQQIDMESKTLIPFKVDSQDTQRSQKEPADQQNSNHNFTVAVRIKPKLRQQNNFKVILNKNHKQIHIETNKSMKGLYNGSKSKNFKMNTIFKEETQTKNIFSNLVQNKMELLKNNCNISLMAYGATNSGKTYTIFGDREGETQNNNKGLAYQCGDYLINNLFKEGYSFFFSYLEIYNENVQDLLVQRDEKKHYLHIFEDCNGKINIPDLTKVEVQNYEHLCQLIEKGNFIRAQASNNLNQRSSRSHALLQIDIYSVEDQENQVQRKPVDANFMIIDLAGSEKSTPYYQQGSQMLQKEGSNINKSLLALGNCIINLQKGQTHIPYRDSKLTRILKNHLSGYCHNIMVACISQQLAQYEQTINTLQYASKAYKIEGFVQNADKNRSQYVQIPCEHCHMNLDFQYLKKIFQHYSYDLIDMLQKNSTRDSGTFRQKHQEKKKKSRSNSFQSKEEENPLVRNKSVIIKRQQQYQVLQPLKLTFKARSLKRKINKSMKKLSINQEQKKDAKDIRIDLYVDQIIKSVKTPTNETAAKYSSVNSKKQSLATDQQFFAPFSEEQQVDFHNLFYSKKPEKLKESDFQLSLKAKFKRNSEPKYDLLNKENQFNFINMYVEEGAKTTREEGSSEETALQVADGFRKAAKRMKPDILEQFKADLQPEILREKPSKQKIKIVPKIR